MEASTKATPRREGVTAVHSLNRFVLTVPALDEAERFYTEFGLEVRRSGGRVDLYTFGHPHCWGTIYEAPGRKKLQYLSFGVYEQDLEPLLQELDRKQIARVPAHPLSDNSGVWLRDPDGNLVQIVAAAKVSPDAPAVQAPPPPHPAGRGAAPTRSAAAGFVRAASRMFSSSARTCRARFDSMARPSMRLSDHCGELIAFMHGAHASDHHMLAFVKSEGPGYHHSSWHVSSIDDVGIGREHMAACGYVRGWGVGRHVIGSNYFAYVQDPWGSFAEFSYDIDFIPADVEWKPGDYPPEDSFYVWGPQPPDYFTVNHEIAG